MSPIWILVCAVVVSVFVVRDVLCSTYRDANYLLMNLFKDGSYIKDVRPSKNFSEPVEVFVNIYLIALNDIDEVNQKMTTTAYLEFFWIDEYLVWDPATYNGLDNVYVQPERMWRPDICLQNGFTKLEALGGDFTLIHVYETGDVYWKPYEVFASKCTIDILYFPFDKQSCDLIFGTWMIGTPNVFVDLAPKGITLEKYQANDEWDVISTSGIHKLSSTDGTKVILTINLKRKPRYYLLNIVLPVLFLSILVTFTFVIPVDCGEKMSYTMTVFLSFAVFLTITSSSLPVSSDPSIMSIYLVFLLTIGTIIVMITGLELRIHHRDSSRVVSKGFCFLVNVAKYLQSQNCKRRNNSVSNIPEIFHVEEIVDKKKDSKTMKIFHEIDDSMNDECEISWPDVSAAIDFLCFFIFLFIIVTVTTVLFTYAYFSAM